MFSSFVSVSSTIPVLDSEKRVTWRVQFRRSSNLGCTHEGKKLNFPIICYVWICFSYWISQEVTYRYVQQSIFDNMLILVSLVFIVYTLSIWMIDNFPPYLMSLQNLKLSKMPRTRNRNTNTRLMCILK